jgi:hypothetical protein
MDSTVTHVSGQFEGSRSNAAPLDKAHENEHNGHYQKDMNKAAHCVG